MRRITGIGAARRGNAQADAPSARAPEGAALAAGVASLSPRGADAITYTLDLDGRVTSWNSAARQAKGYRAVEVLGQHCAMFYTTEDCDAGLPLRALEVAASAGHFRSEAWRVRRDGSRFRAEISVSAIRDERGRLLGFAQDVREVGLPRDFDALGQLAGAVAHDFNNILQAITGSLEIAQLRLARGDTELAECHVTNALHSVERAAHLTRHLLAFARRQPLMPVRFDLSQLVLSAQEKLLRAVGEDVRVDIALDGRPLPVLCDAGQLETALLNLAINGRDAMPRGGRLCVSTRVAPGGGQACLVVEDNGIGMAAGIAARAFEPFFTTKPQGQGAGLGLSMVQGFAEQVNGTVRLRSTPGEGTRVELWLPLLGGGES